MKVLIATLNYNAPKLMDDLWASLKKQMGHLKNWHFYVRENSDKDVWAPEADDRLTVAKWENKGNYASMYNDLVRTGVTDGYDFILQLNNDTIAINDFLSPMLKIFKNDDEVGAVGARLFYPNGHLQHAGIFIHDDLMPYNVNEYSIRKLNLWPGLQAFNREYQAVTGACHLMKVEDYRALNGMDEKFNWCFDDVDLGIRINQELKKKCVYSCDSQLVHIENYSTLKNPTNLKPNLREAFVYLKQKHGKNLKSDSFYYTMDYGRH